MSRKRLNSTLWAKFFILIAAIFPVLLGQDEVDLDDIVERCKLRTELFAEIEEKFTREHNPEPEKPQLFLPIIKELQVRAYNKELLQRPIECIANYALSKGIDNDTLSKSVKFQDLVNQCKASQPLPNCDPANPYRTIDGTCNNLAYPAWGSVLSCARRLLDAFYEGASGLRKSVCGGRDLPNPRDISINYLTDLPLYIPYTSSIFVYFGQFIAHDMTDEPVTFVGDKHLKCCGNLASGEQHPQCAPILLGTDDYFFSLHHVTCIPVVRAAPCDTCLPESRIHMNYDTSYIDLSQVYGLTENEMEQLRRLDGSGKLKVQDTEAGDLMPPDHKADEQILCSEEDTTEDQCPDNENSENETTEQAQCTVDGKENRNYHCFKGGDRRTNQHTPLMCLHTVFMREHNRIADVLKSLNPQWNEEKLFQEARKINIAQYQVMVYTQFMNHLLGDKYMTAYDLHINKGSTRTIYNSSVDATLVSEFSAAAYRLHTIIDYKINLFGVKGIKSSYIRNLYQESSHVYEGKMERMLYGLNRWPYQTFDKHMVTDIRDYLYKPPKAKYGFDLGSVNIQRGRDNGLPPYVVVLKYFSNGKIDIKNFEDLALYISEFSIQQLKLMYCDVRDIDLWVGLVSEIPEPGTIVGPTTAKIIAGQFNRLKFGDRFFFDNDRNWFTEDQLKELKKATLTRVFCDVTKLKYLPENLQEYPNILFNPHRLCSLIPQVDLTKWKEQ